MAGRSLLEGLFEPPTITPQLAFFHQCAAMIRKRLADEGGRSGCHVVEASSAK